MVRHSRMRIFCTIPNSRFCLLYELEVRSDRSASGYVLDSETGRRTRVEIEDVGRFLEELQRNWSVVEIERECESG